MPRLPVTIRRREDGPGYVCPESGLVIIPVGRSDTIPGNPEVWSLRTSDGSRRLDLTMSDRDMVVDILRAVSRSVMG